jgi:hypothetical protein
LQGMDEDDDLLTAMARELVTRQGVGERAADVWSLCRMRHSRHYAESRPMPRTPVAECKVFFPRSMQCAIQLNLLSSASPCHSS